MLWTIKYAGNMPGGDIFQHGIHLQTNDGVLIGDVVTRAAAALTALTTTASGMQQLFPSATLWAAVIVEEIDLTGHVIQTAQTSVSHAGTNVSGCLPGEVAVCVTFRTADVTRSGRGRWYLPTIGPNFLTAQGRLTAAGQTAIITSHNAFFTSLQSVLPGADAVVFSKHTASALSITSYDVGDVLDSQRRRRNKLVESRQGATVS